MNLTYKNYLGVLSLPVDRVFLRYVETFDLPITAYYQLCDINEIDDSYTDFALFASIFFSLFRQINLGSTCIDLKASEFEKEMVFALETEDTKERLNLFCEKIESGAYPKIFGRAGSNAVFIFDFSADKKYIFTNRHFEAENSISKKIHQLLSSRFETFDMSFEIFTKGLGEISISEEQINAIQMALKNNLSVISGGPGTGKTFILGALVYYLLINGYGVNDIAIAAPTGKAAYRISESLSKFSSLILDEKAKLIESIEPKTIHRLFGITNAKGLPFFNVRNPLKCKILVIDESSMIDLDLMEVILNGIDCEKTKIVFIGDANQLPSIASGNLLIDLLSFLPSERKTHLTKCFRTETALSVSFDLVKNKQVEPFLKQLTPLASLKEFDRTNSKVYHIDFSFSKGTDIFDDTLYFWLSHFLYEGYTAEDFNEKKEISEDRISEALHNLNKNKIITSTNIGYAGVDEINKKALQFIRKKFHLFDSKLPNHCPIVILKNNYSQALFNGDQGLVFNVNGVPRAYFKTNTGLQSFRLSELSEFSLSFAQTVHKCQGSEYENVLFIPVIHDVETLNNRPLIYTALTRCKMNAVIMGDLDLLKIGLNRGLSRKTGLGVLMQS